MAKLPDTGDWEGLLAEHGPAVYRSAYRILGRNEEAEDCTQDVFLEVIAKGQQCESDHWAARLRWLAVVRSLDRLRRRRVRREADAEALDTVASKLPGPSDQVSAREMAGWLRSALAKLPPRRAQVFALRCFEGMSYEQIASALEIERGAVGVFLHEARRQLRAMLPQEWIGPREVRCKRDHT